MKASHIAFILSIILSVSMLTDARASSLRCGSRLITIGDYKARVLSECGQPDHIDVWQEERVYRFHSHPRYYGIYDNYEYRHPDNDYEKPYRIKKLVIVEKWTYNHGPGRFMDHLKLENGIVRRITSGDYGF
ncbi:MAG: DUF2845 domain-containing protein [Desulfobacterales bacterium]|nr:DUF2845 domain-containing protein [Desulfobacterales bacterium]